MFLYTYTDIQKKAEEGIKINTKHVQTRVAAATGVTPRTVRRFNVEGNM